MILISCCNENPGLYILKDDTNIEKINDFECRGLTKDYNDNIYVSSHKTKNITKLDKHFNLVEQSNEINNDIHDLFFYKNKFYLLDTYLDKIRVLDKNYNEVYQYSFYDDYGINAPKFFDFELNGNNELYAIPKHYSYDEDNNFLIRNDYFHINDIYINNDYMYLTMFRDWSNLEAGIQSKVLEGYGFLKKRHIDNFSYSLGKTIMDNLTQPHSPLINNNEIFCCNSRMKTITSNKRSNFITTQSFSRGLLIDNNKIYVGQSKSQARPSTTDEYITEEFCGIMIYDLNTYEKINEIKIDSEEVYDIIKV